MRVVEMLQTGLLEHEDGLAAPELPAEDLLTD
jgi:hypothetical protein